jgi:hypothetical protein
VIRMLEGLPDNVVGFEAIGQVDAGDYQKVLDPAVAAALQTQDKLRLLYILGADFQGYTGGAMWEDTKLGAGNWQAWEKIAVVTDTKWLADAVKAFGWIVPGEVRVYPSDQVDEARGWVAS